MSDPLPKLAKIAREYILNDIEDIHLIHRETLECLIHNAVKHGEISRRCLYSSNS